VSGGAAGRAQLEYLSARWLPAQGTRWRCRPL
jgi:hypothetical protein